MSRAIRRTAAAVLLCGALLAGAGCGSSEDDARSAEAADPFSVVPTQPTDSSFARRSAAPRWEPVASFTATGPATRRVVIAPRAIQWRARWRCARGRLELAATKGGARRRLATADCPRSGTSDGFRTGPIDLGIDTPGRWRVAVEQQVDTALHERPLAAMTAPSARVVARGRFYDIERFGRGTATAYRIAGDRLALRLTGFVTSANTDLFVWLSRARRPRTTVAAERSRHRALAGLKSTLGEQNYLLPKGTSLRDVRSIVIWCEPVQIAYTAAALRPVSGT